MLRREYVTLQVESEAGSPWNLNLFKMKYESMLKLKNSRTRVFPWLTQAQFVHRALKHVRG